MGDRIDEKNEKERISRSIVKFWNVNYIPVPQEETGTKEADAEKIQEEAHAQRSEAVDREALYNATTHAYSGEYGAAEVSDAVTKGQIDRILQEKEEVLRNLIEDESRQDKC